MAAEPNFASDSRQLVRDFEAAFSTALTALTSTSMDADEASVTAQQTAATSFEIDEKITKFADLARQLEAWFLQRRLLIHAHNPEMILREENLELRAEIQRKDELLQKFYDKLQQWPSMLNDSATGPQRGQAAAGSSQPASGSAPAGATNASSSNAQMPSVPISSGK